MSFTQSAFIGLFLTCAFCASGAKADGDAAKGEQVFKKCIACHSVADTTKKTGPHLVGLIGRPVASVEGFTYSEPMKEFAKTVPVWDEPNLQTYLEDPRKTVPKTKMVFAGLKKQQERDDLIAFLKSK